MEVAGKVAKLTMSLWKKINAKIEGALVAEREIARKVFMFWTRMENVANQFHLPDLGKVTIICRPKIQIEKMHLLSSFP